METPIETVRQVPIERAGGLKPEMFYEQYLAGAGKPVIVTDATRSWRALSSWNFEFFRNRYASDAVNPRTYCVPDCMKPMAFGEYVDYLDVPETLPQGMWLDPKTLYPCRGPAHFVAPLYLAWNVFGTHPELLGDIGLSPGFVDDWLPLLPRPLRETLDHGTRYFSAGLMIGPKNSRTTLHCDFLDSHAYLAQIVGRKRCLLFSPDDSPGLYGGKVDPEHPYWDKYPLFRQVTTYFCTLEPGEVLFIPWRWWHYVVGLEKSITVNYNFFNRTNFDAYLRHLLRELPALVAGLEAMPEAKAALGIEWTSRGFDLADGSGRGTET
jgi:hypothetical protein